ncbi:hypothetical protein PIB30_111515, partial [Stylosanthes scabra]|nr:hypothetical protein [Stylosanthes scabra]
GQRNNTNPPNVNRPYQPPFQRQPPFQSPPLVIPTQSKQAPNNSIEAALKELTLSTSSFIQSTNTFMEESRANFRNQ